MKYSLDDRWCLISNWQTFGLKVIIDFITALEDENLQQFWSVFDKVYILKETFYTREIKLRTTALQAHNLIIDVVLPHRTQFSFSVIMKPSIQNNQIWQIWIGKYVDSDTNFRSDSYVNTLQCYSWSRNIIFCNKYVISSAQMAMPILNLKCLLQLYLQKDSRYFHTAS